METFMTEIVFYDRIVILVRKGQGLQVYQKSQQNLLR